MTTDEESGLAVSEVMDQAAENGIDLYSMEEGEAVTFMATDYQESYSNKRNLLSVFGLRVWKLSDLQIYGSVW